MKNKDKLPELSDENKPSNMSDERLAQQYKNILHRHAESFLKEIGKAQEMGLPGMNKRIWYFINLYSTEQDILKHITEYCILNKRMIRTLVYDHTDFLKEETIELLFYQDIDNKEKNFLLEHNNCSLDTIVTGLEDGIFNESQILHLFEYEVTKNSSKIISTIAKEALINKKIFQQLKSSIFFSKHLLRIIIENDLTSKDVLRLISKDTTLTSEQRNFAASKLSMYK